MLSSHYICCRSMFWVRRGAQHWHPHKASDGQHTLVFQWHLLDQCLGDLGTWVRGSVITVICEVGKGCQLGWGWTGYRFSRDKRTEKQLPITAHPVKKQMKGQASYQLLVVSPEVRKSKELKGKGVGKWGWGRGKKKDKIVISKLSHALHDSLQTHFTTGPRVA